jgi:hypothetical protein
MLANAMAAAVSIHIIHQCSTEVRCPCSMLPADSSCCTPCRHECCTPCTKQPTLTPSILPTLAGAADTNATQQQQQQQQRQQQQQQRQQQQQQQQQPSQAQLPSALPIPSPAAPPPPPPPATPPAPAPGSATHQPAASLPHHSPPAHSIRPLPQRAISVGYAGDWLDIHPAAAQAWATAHLEPYSSRKNVAFLALCPEQLTAQVDGLMRNVSAAYQTCRLGGHWAAAVPPGVVAHLASSAAAAGSQGGSQALQRYPVLQPPAMAALQRGIIPLAAGQQQGVSRQAQQQQQQQQPSAYAQAARECVAKLRSALSTQLHPPRYEPRRHVNSPAASRAAAVSSAAAAGSSAAAAGSREQKHVVRQHCAGSHH